MESHQCSTKMFYGIPQIDQVIVSLLNTPSGVEIERSKAKTWIAKVRAIANPHYERRVQLQEPIPRNVWVRWCSLEDVQSGLPFYCPHDIAKLMRTCIWFAKGGTQRQLEEIIIKEEQNANENAA